MRKMQLAACATVVLTMVVAAPVVAIDLSDIRAMGEAELTLAEAIEAAEAAVGGHTVSASIDDESREPQFEIDVRVGDEVFEVTVSATDGTILRVAPDRD